MHKYRAGTLKPSESFPSERRRFHMVALAWAFQVPDQAVWDAQEPDWLLDLIDYGEAAPEPSGAPAPGKLAQTLGLEKPRAGTDDEKAAATKRALAARKARTAEVP